MRTLLSGGTVYIDGIFKKLDISLVNNKIEMISNNINNNEFKKVITCDNFFIVPGFIDMHVHLREPGFSFKETIKTGTIAAAAGGFTTVCTMPNLKPVPADVASVRAQLDIIERDGQVEVLPYGSITATQTGEGCLSDMKKISDMVVAFSDDGVGIKNEETMEKAMKLASNLGKTIVAHCEDLSFNPEDSASEWKQVARDLQLVMKTGCAYHICHVSSKETVQLVRAAKGAGINVTCETAPHYLAFNKDDVKDSGQFKMNPPIRSKEDQAELIEGIKDGTIDMIATDHAPHSEKEKNKGFKNSLNGIVGLETAFPVLYTQLVEKNIISLEKLVKLMSVNPAKRFNLQSGKIEIDSPANITILKLGVNDQIESNKFQSMGHSTPFEGMRVSGQVAKTIYNGKIVWEV